ncbi:MULTISPECIES: exopolysaccharide biosynthesis polyprenyl glycosylphosphotransferase [Sphingopyxis]|uniref:exopolysaccharide biosynthesis polyprenyl glycosylphosphotransferase n=1 Tax=Sphingopyxis TaxID=165697 RepID=UPI001646AF64|nr:MULTISPECIES: exopolysaccharide biosynthesis polyprenyl glycosylphosphotransferase [Sphingopyxis]QXF11822.1 exopolysaccharide biosynthesis polyprenyl glycosylphosphotransferase [Sphingopyxis terrae subsp. terrae]
MDQADAPTLGADQHLVRPARMWPRWFGSLRLQLFLCCVFGVFVPVMTYIGGDLSIISSNGPIAISVVTATITTIVGVVATRKFGSFPGSFSISYVFPALASSYAIALAIILLMRAPYSGMLLSVTFVCVLTTRFAIGAVEPRRDTNRYYLVPGGDIERIRSELEADCIILKESVLPEDPSAVIVADLHHDHLAEWERAFAVAALKGIAIYHYKQVWEARTGKVRIEHLSENSLGSLMPSNSYAKIKRLIDIALTLAVLPILLLPLLLTGLLIRLDSPGPMFFRQERIGYRGQAFSVLKFRTMRVAQPVSTNDDGVQEAITKDQDERITRIGRFLRKTRIDELPQLFNILRGEMSWIGPRPEARPLSEWYEREIPFFVYRHIVRPGITGWAQVNQGHVVGISDVHDKLRFDFFYIKNFSMWLDILILFKTVVVIVKGYGAK